MTKAASQYLQEQQRLYSKLAYPHEEYFARPSFEYKPQRYERIKDSNNNGSMNEDYGRGSRGFFERFKSKLNLFRDNSYDSEDQHSVTMEQRQLWDYVKDKPIDLRVTDPDLINDDCKSSPNKEPALRSANTFLTPNAMDDNFGHMNRAGHLNAEKKPNGNLSSVPFTGSPLTSTAANDFIGIDLDASLFRESPWTGLSGRSPLARRTTMQTILKRLVHISTKKQEVAKSYQKLLKELGDWWQDTIESEESATLITDLQKLFHEDMVMELRISSKLKEISQALEFTKLREDEMLQVRKELQSTAKKYAHVKSKKGGQSEDAAFLREKVTTKQNSLAVITGHYLKALSVTARELFVNASVDFFETSSELKDASKRFFQGSVEYLRTIQANNIEQHIEDLRKKRADKHWEKLTPLEKNDPNRLGAIMTGMYNGQDSLMKCVTRKMESKTDSDAANQKINDPKSNFKLEFKTGLDDTVSGITSEKTEIARPDRQIVNVSHLTLERVKHEPCSGPDLHKTLRKESPTVLSDQKRNRKTGEIPGAKKQTSDRHEFNRYHRNGNISKENSDDNGLIIKFGESHTKDVSHSFYEPENELNCNRWIETAQIPEYLSQK
ncbi:LAMI_0F15192g1_1 [Lachancea mirantina]|uniref:LAMI_0F15192g1_1 n=1 Tax=Lachancea mirantina TaxID=1230905 RepID=A0A1G4K4I3_9SACH|nr:LAMI_0F15192g1_1 [Lachancea mirantina]